MEIPDVNSCNYTYNKWNFNKKYSVELDHYCYVVITEIDTGIIVLTSMGKFFEFYKYILE